MLMLANRTTAAVGEEGDCCCYGCAAAGASRTAAVDSLLLGVRTPGLVSFSAVHHVGQAYNFPQVCSRWRHAGASATRSNRASTNGSERSTTGRAFTGRGHGRGVSSAAPVSPTEEREK